MSISCQVSSRKMDYAARAGVTRLAASTGQDWAACSAQKLRDPSSFLLSPHPDDTKSPLYCSLTCLHTDSCLFPALVIKSQCPFRPSCLCHSFFGCASCSMPCMGFQSITMQPAKLASLSSFYPLIVGIHCG